MNPNVAIEVCHLADAAATRELGRRLAGRLLEARAGREPGSHSLDGRPEATVTPPWDDPHASPPCQLLLLQGELGAGKTCLVQGLAEGLGITEPITSPTFALAQHYMGAVAMGDQANAAAIAGISDASIAAPHHGETTGIAGSSIHTALVHLDLYRLEQPASADELFAQEEEEARSLGAVLAVEWPERLSLVPDGAWRVELEIVGEERVAKIKNGRCEAQ